MNIDLPTKWKVNTPAWSDSIVSPFGSANWIYSTNGNNLEVNLNRLLNGTSIDPKQYPDFQSFLDGVKERDLREVVITRKAK